MDLSVRSNIDKLLINKLILKNQWILFSKEDGMLFKQKIYEGWKSRFFL